MKKTTKFSGFIAAIMTAVVLSACGPQKDDSNAGDGQATAAPVFNDERYAAVYEAYIYLKDALVASMEDEARAAAGTLKAALQETPEADKAAQAAAAVSEAADITAQRLAFSDLSNAMAELMKKADIASGEVYLAFCPMANDNEGAYWLASEQQIRNPYFGDKMMTCGEVKETIN